MRIVYARVFRVFFFSSRRRHTRFKCDWSSDVLFRSQLTVDSVVRWAPPVAWQEAQGVRGSEEHTSELQSHLNLVCRLLLEKKKHYGVLGLTRRMQHPHRLVAGARAAQ